MKPFPRLLYQLNRLRYRLTRPVTLGVRLLLLQEGKVLLVQHTYQPEWYLPGGKVERGETLEDAARREAREEVGATLGPLRLFGVYTNFYEGRSDHILVFACDAVALTDRKTWEIERLAWFAPDALPDDVSPGCRRRIAEYATAYSTPRAALW
ncbi:MAG TPA: NUDIX domain-containing protein [Anaerolineae bacterium]|nr:NUDIX domain-containing protein [Anaerolineae bacterium]